MSVRAQAPAGADQGAKYGVEPITRDDVAGAFRHGSDPRAFVRDESVGVVDHRPEGLSGSAKVEARQRPVDSIGKVRAQLEKGAAFAIS